MSRRSGQNGYIEKSGNWYVVRWRMDVEGQDERRYLREKICPISGPDKLSASERERKAKVIVERSGANSEQHFNRVVLGETMFREQARVYLQWAVTRHREPIKDAASIKAALHKWILPAIGDMPLGSVNNITVKPVVDKMKKSKSLSARTVNKYVEYIKQVVASLKDGETGEPIQKRTWDSSFMDLPMVNQKEERRPSLKAKAITQLVEESEGEEQALFVLLAATGMRISEALALETKHITNDGRTIEVRQQVARHTPHHHMLKDKCGLSRCRLAPGRCGVPATLYWRQTRSIVRYPEWHATLTQQHRGSLANGTAQGDGIRRVGYGLARFPSFPQNVAVW